MKNPTLKRPSSGGFDNTFEAKKLNMGWLGKFFGSGDAAQDNIIGMVLLLSLAAGIFVTIFHIEMAIEFWKTLAPILTGIVFYMLGNKNQTNG